MVDYVTKYFRLTPSVKYMYEFNCFILYFFKDSQVTQQSDLNYIGEHLDIRLAVVDNLKHNGLKHKLSLVLTNTGNKTIKPGDWSIYFYSFLMIEPEHLPKAKEYILPHYNLKLMHIKGSLFSITPTNGFPNLTYNQSHYSEFSYPILERDKDRWDVQLVRCGTVIRSRQYCIYCIWKEIY